MDIKNKNKKLSFLAQQDQGWILELQAKYTSMVVLFVSLEVKTCSGVEKFAGYQDRQIQVST